MIRDREKLVIQTQILLRLKVAVEQFDEITNLAVIEMPQDVLDVELGRIAEDIVNLGRRLKREWEE